jgi:cullin 1
MITTNDFPKTPPKTADFNEKWAFLKVGIECIMNHLEGGIPFEAYTGLYTTVYNCFTPLSTVVYRRSECPFCSLFCILADSCAPAGAARFNGLDLYNKLSEYFILHFQPMLQVRWDESLINTYLSHNLSLQVADTLSGVDLLRYYASEWDHQEKAKITVDRRLNI